MAKAVSIPKAWRFAIDDIMKTKNHGGHGRYKQRHGEGDGNHLGEWHRGDGEVKARIGRKAQQTSCQHENRFAGYEPDGLFEQRQAKQHQKHRDATPDENNLQNRKGVTEVLDDIVLDRKKEKSEYQDKGSVDRIEWGVG